MDKSVETVSCAPYVSDMNGDELSDKQILELVNQIDNELFNTGVDIKQRHWKASQLIMSRLGYISYIMNGHAKPAILDRIEAAFKSIYRPQDIAIGGHVGVFMYRDIFVRISVPLVFGQVSLNPFDHIELTPIQLRILQTEPETIEIFLDQFSDIFDIQYGTTELKE